MGRTAPTKAGKHPVEAAPTAPINEEVPYIDTHRANRSIPRDAVVVMALHTTLNKAVHLHDPIEPQEADRIFAFAVNGLADHMLLPILTSGQHVLEGRDLSFQRDSQPVAPSSDRHASKLVRKRLKRRKQGYAAAVKMSIYGNYAASRASSRTESRFGGSRFGGSRASAAIWGAVSPSKVPTMSLIYGLHSGGESLMNSSWISSQQGSTDTKVSVDRGAIVSFSSTSSYSTTERYRSRQPCAAKTHSQRRETPAKPTNTNPSLSKSIVT
ncbi:hypothetical protein PF008_g6773 [Phytophthora fragariae]|uniref:Uncharacterized protein n=1 Tax=Phytophthora fragariae TaxID=53985 RepID=A0A6G0S5G9_9STRA|nr:hypothetical protein PF008_g6773 [Phytophthora fragariae]